MIGIPRTRRVITRALRHWWRLTRGLTLGAQGVVIDARSQVLLVRHGYRPGWFFPGGGVERNETLQDALARELEEETGFRAGRLEEIGRFYSSPGMVSESFTLVRATDLEDIGPGGGTDSEDIAVHRVSRAGLKDFLDRKRAEGCGVDVRLLLLLGQDIIAGE